MTITDFLDAQKNFYHSLQLEYKLWFRNEHKTGALRHGETVNMIKKGRRTLSLEEFVYSGKDPGDLQRWSHSKRLDFERKKLMKL